MNFSQWQNRTRARLRSVGGDVALEARLLLAHTMQLTGAQVAAAPERALSAGEEKELEALVLRRLQGEPLSYILGYAEFAGLRFRVAAGVLVPRSDTEPMVDWLVEQLPSDFSGRIADLGCGSGAIAITLKKRLPNSDIHAFDVSTKCLHFTTANARHYALDIHVHHGDWLSQNPHRFDAIISNPPYISSNDPALAELSHEPPLALIAGVRGTEAIEKIAEQASDSLKGNGLMVVEHGYNQFHEVARILSRGRWIDTTGHTDLSGVPRFCSARRGWG